MSYIDYAKKDQVAWVLLNRSEFNPLNYEMVDELIQVWRDLQEDPAIRVAVLGSARANFCTGFDIQVLKGMVEKSAYTWDDSVMFGRRRVGPGHNGVNKPIIGAYHGIVNATGFWLALQADIILATPQTTFGLGEGLINYPVEFSGLLARFLPRALSNQLLLTARPLPAQRLYEVGAVNQIVEHDQLMAAAAKTAARVCACGPGAQAVMKRLAVEAATQGAEEIGVRTGELCVPEINSDDTREGMAAFFAKRRPQWGGGGQDPDSSQGAGS